MPRLGVEPKPAWREVPGGVRDQVESLLGARVTRGLRIYGGYAPSATFRLFLDDGRRVVFKGTQASLANEVMIEAIAAEQRVYAELGELIQPWAPAYFGAIRQADWNGMLLEDVGPPQVPPWTPRYAAEALRDYARFHLASLGRSDFPDWLSRTEHHSVAESWAGLLDSADGLDNVAGLAGERADEARAWLGQHIGVLRTTAERLRGSGEPRALVHFDTRSDNVRIQRGGRLRIFDWPFAFVGPAEIDMVAFVQSIATEGGPSPEQCVAWYAEGNVVREVELVASIASMAGFFADRAWRPPIPRVPRVRSIQRRQLRTTLAWAARALELDEPRWLQAVPD